MRLVLIIAAAGVSCTPLVARADRDIYVMVDDGGGVHLTNFPDDDRYRVAVRVNPPEAAVTAASEQHGGTALGTGDPGLRPYDTVVRLAATQYGIDPALLHAVISVESAYNPTAVSKRGAAGLMQLMPETARRYGVANVFDPLENVRAGAHYLTDLLKLFRNDLSLALAAYNAGEKAVLKFGGRVPPYPETAAYVPRVVDSYARLRSLM